MAAAHVLSFLLFVVVVMADFVPLQVPFDVTDEKDNEKPDEHDKQFVDNSIYNYMPGDGSAHEHAATKSKRKADAEKNILHRRKEDQHHTEATAEEVCPSTFVYELEELSKSKAPSGTLEGVFGEEMHVPGWVGGLYKTKEETLLDIFLYRLRIGKRCPQATHPDLADLFLVPILPSADASAWEMNCDRLVSVNWQQLLPFLETKTAARHVLVMPEPDEHGRVPCSKFWYYLPAELRAAQILAADVPSDESIASLLPPTIKTVPRPTTVHWSTAFLTSHQDAPWVDVKRSRPIFASFFGGAHGPTRFQELRKHLRVNCDKDPKCEMIVKTDGHAVQELRDELPHIMKSKHRSIFCLEPPGTTFARQSLVQSILSGCIPVIFDKEQDNLFQWHWGPWRKGSRVLLEVPKVCFTSFEEEKEECDVIAQLHTLSATRIQTMQRKITKRAQALMYALGDYDGDAFDITLRELAKVAKAESEHDVFSGAVAESQPLIHI